MQSANDLRARVSDDEIVEIELSIININLLKNKANLSANISSTTNTAFNGNTVVGSPMTLDSNYWAAWQNIVANNHCTAQMASVIDFYNKLGYTINRKSNDGQHLYWTISW
jgi:hypothetical protein